MSYGGSTFYSLLCNVWGAVLNSCDLLQFNAILKSFGALVIFPKIQHRMISCLDDSRKASTKNEDH